MVQIIPIPAFDDNYIWCIHNQTSAYVVDPGDHAPVIQYLQQYSLTLEGILVTHHHNDHIGGIKQLKNWHQGNILPIIGPNTPRFPFVTQAVDEGDSVPLEALTISLQIMEVPGHTKDHIAFFGEINASPVLFCGDTLFSAGCGRLFEGNAEQMQHNFERFRQLPPETNIYCTHEYTLANLEFAMAVWPQNSDLAQYQQQASQLREDSLPTLPSNIGLEMKINPFMNTDHVAIRASAEAKFATTCEAPVEVFAALRSWKDNF